jgi:hypothetical protein
MISSFGNSYKTKLLRTSSIIKFLICDEQGPPALLASVVGTIDAPTAQLEAGVAVLESGTASHLTTALQFHQVWLLQGGTIVAHLEGRVRSVQQCMTFSRLSLGFSGISKRWFQAAIA